MERLEQLVCASNAHSHRVLQCFLRWLVLQPAGHDRHLTDGMSNACTNGCAYRSAHAAPVQQRVAQLRLDIDVLCPRCEKHVHVRLSIWLLASQWMFHVQCDHLRDDTCTDHDSNTSTDVVTDREANDTANCWADSVSNRCTHRGAKRFTNKNAHCCANINPDSCSDSCSNSCTDCLSHCVADAHSHPSAHHCTVGCAIGSADCNSVARTDSCADRSTHTAPVQQRSTQLRPNIDVLCPRSEQHLHVRVSRRVLAPERLPDMQCDYLCNDIFANRYAHRCTYRQPYCITNGQTHGQPHRLTDGRANSCTHRVTVSGANIVTNCRANGSSHCGANSDTHHIADCCAVCFTNCNTFCGSVCVAHHGANVRPCIHVGVLFYTG
jgi:hypothetical protein